jgi:hypothetical protein
MTPDSVYSAMLRNPKEILTAYKTMNDAKRKKRSGDRSGNALKARAMLAKMDKYGRVVR